MKKNQINKAELIFQALESVDSDAQQNHSFSCTLPREKKSV